MIRRFFVALALSGGALFVAPEVADAQVSYNQCFSNCHEAAMYVYDEYGLNAATVYFDGCMDYCPLPS